MRDISADSFIRWRSQQQRTGATANHYLDACLCFLNGLVKREILDKNPLSRIEKTKAPKTRHRRAFTDIELQNLFAIKSPRRLIYLIAAYTGLRREEIRALQWGDFVVQDGLAWLAVRESTTKNGKAATIPLMPQIKAELLLIRGQNYKTSNIIFKRIMPKMPKFRDDLKLAGIPYRDGQNRHADFHAFRVTFDTMMQKAGVPLRVIQELMRHSDPRLSANVYTDKQQLPIFEVHKKLTWLGDNTPKEKAPEEKGTRKWTGTDFPDDQTPSGGVTVPFDEPTLEPSENEEEKQAVSRFVFPRRFREKMEAAGVEPASSS